MLTSGRVLKSILLLYSHYCHQYSSYVTVHLTCIIEAKLYDAALCVTT